MIGIFGLRSSQTLSLNRDLIKEIVGLIFSEKPDFSSYNILAAKLFNRFAKHEVLSITEAVQFIMDMSFTIDRVKIDNFGYVHSTLVSNNLIMSFVDRVAIQSALFDYDPETMQNIINFMKVHNGWMVPKLIHFRKSLDYLAYVCWWVAQLKIPNAREIYRGIFDEMPGMKTAAKETMENLNILRRYGIKNCFFRDGLLHEEDECWAIYDFNDLRRIFDESAYQVFSKKDRYLAMMCLSIAKEGVSPSISREINKAEEWFSVNATLPMGTKFILTIDRVGELWIHLGYFDQPLRKIFELNKLRYEYELIRLYFIARLFDLTVPVKVVREMPPLPTVKRDVEQKPAVLKPRPIITSELIIPRIKKIRETPELMRFLEEELGESEVETQKRALRRHIVINHIRQLTEGYHSSQEARERAWKELGIVLGDNETYVRKHERGNIGEPILPKAIRR
jgi:hypothetical protein